MRIGKKVWSLGPMFLCNTDMDAMEARGDKTSVDGKHCLQWLDSMKPGQFFMSVLEAWLALWFHRSKRSHWA